MTSDPIAALVAVTFGVVFVIAGSYLLDRLCDIARKQADVRRLQRLRIERNRPYERGPL